MHTNKKRALYFVVVGLVASVCICAITFFVGWQLSNYLFVTTPKTAIQTPIINLVTQKIDEKQGDIYGELIMICTSSSDAIFVQLDGKYFDAPNYCGMWSPDGRYVIMSDFNVTSGPGVLLRQRGSDKIINITENLPLPGWISFFSWSPDGKYVSIAGHNYDETKNGIYLINMESGIPPKESRLLFHTDQNHDFGLPVWSPNGKFIGIPGGGYGSPYVLNLDGKIIWEPPQNIYPLVDAFSWSSDSTRFVYTAFTEKTTAENYDTQLVIGDITNGKAYPIKLPMRASFPQWSKDGKWIIFTMAEGIGNGVFLYAIQPNGRNLTQLGEDGRMWDIGQGSPDGSKFLIGETETASERYYMVNLHDFSKVMFFQNDSFASMPLSVYPLIWLPAINK